ncbi:MAG: glycosyltransferase [Flavobacteriaceae bacterium]|nr:glycosyltransferase [Flavobacteriaceae bacterium]
MMAKRICFILNYAPHYRTEVLLEIDRNFDCDFFMGNKTYTDIRKMDTAALKRSRELGFVKIWGHFYWLRGQAAMAFKKYDSYVITGQPYNLSSWIFLILSRIRGKKVFIWNHGMYGNEGPLQKILKKIQFNLITGYLLYGNYARTIMIENGFKKEKLHVIYNSLAYKAQFRIRQKLQSTSVYKEYFKNDLPVIIFIGRLTGVKKLDLLLKAMKLSFDEGLRFNTVFVGDGMEKSKLQQLVADYELNPNVWFYGSLYDETKIGELLYNADFCVSPGNVGLTAMHALTFGCPVLTHANFKKQMPEFEAIRENSTGGFFQENDPDALRKAIQDWLEKHPVKDKKLIAACYEVIDSHYNPERQIEVLKKVLL